MNVHEKLIYESEIIEAYIHVYRLQLVRVNNMAITISFF